MVGAGVWVGVGFGVGVTTGFKVGDGIGIGIGIGINVGLGVGVGFGVWKNAKLGNDVASKCFTAIQAGEEPWKRQKGKTMLKNKAENNIELQNLNYSF